MIADENGSRAYSRNHNYKQFVLLSEEADLPCRETSSWEIPGSCEVAREVAKERSRQHATLNERVTAIAPIRRAEMRECRNNFARDKLRLFRLRITSNCRL